MRLVFFLRDEIPLTAGGVTATALDGLEWATWEMAAAGGKWQRDAGFFKAVAMVQRSAA